MIPSVHSWQHYDASMDTMVFDQFESPHLDTNLRVGSGTHAITTARILERLEPYLKRERIEGILVHGDTNMTLGEALVAAKLNLPIGHVDAGLRSFDRTMPEEVNRIVVDLVSTHLFAPTDDAVCQLHREGMRGDVVMTGQTSVDAIEYLRPRIKMSALLSQYNLHNGQYYFMTCRRQENTSDRHKLLNIIRDTDQVCAETDMAVVFSIHPRTKFSLKQYGCYDELVRNLRFIVIDPPCDYFTSLVLHSNARVILTDSGGIQEEACIPCVTFRKNTERPETVEMGANVLAYRRVKSQGSPQFVGSGAISGAVKKMLQVPYGWAHKYGDGKTSYRILNHFAI